MTRKGRGSGLGIGEIGAGKGAGYCGSYRQIAGVGSGGLAERMAVSEMFGKL